MKNIVTIGGGTGTFTVLAALKQYPVHLTAVVSMADDGGSTGLLRDQYGVLPPGDVRRALVALSESSETMRDLFNYRFKGGGLQEHNFGNLFLAALEKVTGSFSSALAEASHILNVSGEVAPVTFDDIRLFAQLTDGKIIRGETNIDIPRTPRRAAIKEVWLEPEARMNPGLKRIFKNADLILMGPGDLYTSVVPNLLVPGVKEEIKKSKAKKVFICNLMTKRGETDGFSGEDFLRAMEKRLGKNVLDFVVFNNKRPSERLLKRYRREGAEFVAPPSGKKHTGKPKYIFADLLEAADYVRHDPHQKLGKVLMSL
jgi:uncharacterized cofD-like protein